MKRFTFLAISLLLISGFTYAIQPKMVVEGRTWWYNIEKTDGTKCDLLTSDWHSEFGIQIGDEVVIDGTTWHEINVVKRGDGHYYHGMIYDDEYPICISYIREADNNVFALLDYDLLAAYPPILKVMQASRWAQFISPEPEEVKIYHFGNEGETFDMGAGKDAAACQISSIGVVTNINDHNFPTAVTTEYSADQIRVNEPGFMNGHSAFTVIEGIGAYSTDKENISLFFAPLTDNTSESEFTLPVLRYVTDGVGHRDKYIIYQAAGGYMEWEDYSSIVDIESTPADEPARWYGVGGVEVSAPQAPGIYVKVVGTTATKVVVK